MLDRGRDRGDRAQGSSFSRVTFKYTDAKIPLRVIRTLMNVSRDTCRGHVYFRPKKQRERERERERERGRERMSLFIIFRKQRFSSRRTGSSREQIFLLPRRRDADPRRDAFADHKKVNRIRIRYRT